MAPVPDRLEIAALMLGFTNEEVVAYMTLAKQKFPGENREMLVTRVIHVMKEQRDNIMIERARSGIADEDDGA